LSAGNGLAYDMRTFYFVGLISDVAFVSATFTSVEQGPLFLEAFNVDNLSYAAIQPVPEPTTIALTALGLAGLGVVRKRRQRR
jgi:PEP-CTERM motif